MSDVVANDRTALVRQALRLEYLTVGWNVVEGIVAVSAAALAGSVALLGFGIDSFVESASGAVLIWRLLAERRGIDAEEMEHLDARAHKLVGASLFLLGAYIAVDAGTALWNRDAPRPSAVGIVLTAVSILAMRWLARAKRRAARRLGSRALEADAFQTTACFWLSIITLAGIGLNAALGWWWADPAAALGMTWFIAKEGTEAWRGEECGCSGETAHAVSPESTAGPGCGCSGSGGGEGLREAKPHSPT
jgi:divalent metal cation (Fe/Co/Zn/Cd) transporter